MFSCKKPENRKCFKSSGSNSTIRIDLNNFDKLVLKKGIKYKLIQDDSTYLKISGGKNLLNFIEHDEIETGKILIENKNKCNFLRKYSKTIDVEIHFINLNEIRYEGTEILNNLDTLFLNDFKFEIIDACGTVDLIVKANKIEADTPFGFGNYNLRGIVNEAKLSIQSNGFCNAENLIIKSILNVDNSSPGDMYINAENINLMGKITGSGNIYYIGNPKTNEVKCFSTGKLIKK